MEPVKPATGQEVYYAEPAPTQADSTAVQRMAEDGEFVYTINETSDKTARLLNMILDYLDTEKEKKRAYTGKKVKLCIKDKENNSFLVEDIYVYPDAFLALARFFNL